MEEGGTACQMEQSGSWIKVQTCPPMAEGGIAAKRWKPLTGTDAGISLSVYLDLLARGCRPSSFQTDWDEDSRLTRDRKDWRRERDQIWESRGAKGERDSVWLELHNGAFSHNCQWMDIYWAVWFKISCACGLLWCSTLGVERTLDCWKNTRTAGIEERNVKRPAERVGKAFTFTVCFCPSLTGEAASRLEDQAHLLDTISSLPAFRFIETQQNTALIWKQSRTKT